MYFVDLGGGGVDVWASATGTHSSSAKKTVFYCAKDDVP